jgi:glutamate racemase
MNPAAPIGIFDSGVGGLSVAHELRRMLPAERLLYAADTAFCPYGGRPIPEIRARSVTVGRFLVDRGAKVLVVACNTASGAALEALRAELPIPVVGIEPAVKPAAAATRNGRVGVLATEATLHTDRFDRLMQSYAQGVEVTSIPCPALVELVEHADTTGAHALDVVRETLAPLVAAGVDTVVLGCTHYVFLREPIRDVMGSEVALIDSGVAVARQVGRVLAEREQLAGEGAGGMRFLTTGDAEAVARVVERLWGEPLDVEHADVA